MSAAAERLAEIDAAGGDITMVPLSPGEEVRLARLEEVVQHGLTTFVEVGQALAAIRDGRLYRQTHVDFASYVKDRFGLSRSRAYQQMNAAEVAAVVSTVVDIPMNERQARELVGLEPEQAREVYQQAVADTAGRPTAQAIRNARNTGPIIPAPAPRAKPLPETFTSAGWKLQQAATSLERLTKDARWRSNVDSVRGRSQAEIRVAIRAIDAVVRAMGLGELHLVEKAEPTLFPEEDSTADVVVTIEQDKVVVLSGGFNALNALHRLGIETSKRGTKTSFPTSALPDVEAALEADGMTLQVCDRSGTW